MVLAPPAAAGLSLWTQSWIPLASLVALAAAAIITVAARARPDAGWYSRLLFGVHYFLREVPMLTGQLLDRLDRLRGRKRFIEYKPR